MKRTLIIALAALLIAAPVSASASDIRIATIASCFREGSVSMAPTIAKNGFVSIVPYPNINNAQRGDVVAFRHPVTNDVWVKRLIGMPGEKIQMKEGRLYIDGEIVPREPIAKVHTEDFYGLETDVPTYRETLPGGVSYTIIQIQGDTGFNGNTQVFDVPAENYFMMGDNRDNSTDSRVAPDQGGVGFVPFENLVGAAQAAIDANCGRGPTGQSPRPWPGRPGRFGPVTKIEI